MKILNSKIIKIPIFTLFILILSTIFSNSYGYQLNTVGVRKEYLYDFGDENFPEMLYRKQVAAYGGTARKYNNGTYPKNEGGWVEAKYITPNDLPQDGEISTTWQTYEHRTWYTFQRIYEYFHQYQNSNYRIEPYEDYKDMNYSTGEFRSTDSKDVQVIGKATCYNVYSETGNYSGVYHLPLTPNNLELGVETIAEAARYSVNNPEIVVMDTNLYRFAVSKNNVFVSDNILTQETLEKLTERFGENITAKTLTVYNSSILRTSVENGEYYAHMDTAYKFLRTTKYGKEDWVDSPSIYGGSNGSSSFINYYDNTLELPISNNKKVYIRHIDVTGEWNLTNDRIKNKIIKGNQTQNGQIIQISGWKDFGNEGIPIFKSYEPARITPTNVNEYSDYYELKPAHNASYFIGNMRYTNTYFNSEEDTIPAKTVKTLKGEYNQYTSREKEIVNEYVCVGKAVGKGASLEIAEYERNKDIEKLRNVNNLVENDYNNLIINSGDAEDVIVIDFYYVKPRQNAVYVRHIDLSEYGGKITKQNVDRCVEKNSLLNGTRIAKYDPFEDYNTINSSTPPSGYSELYYNDVGKDLRVYVDDRVNYTDKRGGYICVGTNMTSSNVNLEDAKAKMDDRLSGNPSSNESASYIQVSPGNEVTIVDFYYVKATSSVTPDPIERTPIGRLSFYTASPTDSNKFLTVNSKAANNNSVVYDVIPSGESLTPSIDNTYNYMLAGINIQERKDENLNHYLTYTITQPFKIYCRDGTTTLEEYEKEYTYRYRDCLEYNENGGCSDTETYEYEETFYCSASGDTFAGGIDTNCNCLDHYIYYEDYNGNMNISYHNIGSGSGSHNYKYTNEDFHILDFSEYDSGNNIHNYSYNDYTWNDKDNVLNLKLEYKIKLPYITTFYKVKNIRTYTISKLELLDGYANAGLPLFDGNTHIAYASDTYKDLFNNATFENAKLTSKLNRSSITLPTLNVYYNNIDDPIEITTTYMYRRYRGQEYYDTTLDTTSTKSNMRELISDINNVGIKSTLQNLEISELAKLSGFEKEDVNTDRIDRGRLEIDTTGDIEEEKTALTVTYTLTNDRVKLGNGNVIVGKNISNPDNIVTTTDKTMGITKREETEYKSTVVVDLSKYDGDTINISTLYPSSIRGESKNAVGSQYLPSSSLTYSSYFNKLSLKIPETSLNGKRYSYGRVEYTIDQPKVNWDANIDYSYTGSYSSKSSYEKNYSSYQYFMSKGSYRSGSDYNDFNQNTFEDTEMFNTDGKVGSKTTFIDSKALGNIVWEYGENNTFENVKKNPTSSSKDVDVIDVFTPITFDTEILTATRTQTQGFVNHTNEENSNQIQKNARFTIQINATNYTNNNGTNYYSLSTNKYLKEYYIKFNFDVQDIIIYDARTGNNGRRYEVGTVTAGTWIGPIHNLNLSGTPADSVRISAFALADANQALGVVEQETNTYTVRATAYNIPSNLIYDLNMGAIRASNINTFVNSDRYNRFIGKDNFKQSHQQYYSKTDLLGHSQYVAEKKYTTDNISRVYDFKVTDLKDIDWKNIFRTSTSATTNVHTSKAYYSGVYKWNIYTTKVSEMITRDVSEIGTTQQQTLPLGPYKNTSSTYTKAPKLGYKFSFDLKTTGANANKEVVITPRFYYVGKDGTGYTENIKLFYKNSSNKYVVADSYKLYMVPDDGYRLTFEGTDAAYRFSGSKLINSTVTLGTVKEIVLNNKMMQMADNNFVQIWYGEYKLPNSTIAVKVEKDENNKEKYNINNKLTNGYIGVVFDIKVNEYETSDLTDDPIRVISYSQNDNNYIDENNQNTSQWDYEGYLGLKSVGNEIANPSASTAENADKQRISIQLEKGEWQLDNTTYNKIKGTVILYDTDAKASSDYE